MDVSEDLASDYPQRLYLEGASIFENKSINTNSHFSEIPRLRQAIGIDVWDNLKTYPVGLIAKLAESKLVWSGKTVHYLLCRQLRVYKKEIWSLVVDQPLRFSLIELGEITGLNTNPLPEESFEPDQENYKTLWELLKVPLGYGPKFDELIEALTECPFWSADQRKWYGLLFLQAIGLYGLHHNCRIPFESAKRVFDDDALMTYPWGRTAYEFLVDSIKFLHPQGGSYTLSGFKDVLLVWAYESVTVFGELYGRKVNPDEIPLLRWGGSRTRASGDFTNKVTPQECRGVPHHLLGVFDSEAGNLTATDFCRLASQEISTLSANNKLPIVAGGSNSYIEALANHSSGFLLNKYQCCFIWVDVSLPVLNSFVSKRVDRMMEAGLLEEVRELHDPKADYSVGIRRAIGVPELHEYLCYESLVDRGTQRKMLDAAVKKIKENTEILACRQLLKIQRLSKKWKLSMHRVDATEVFLKRTEEEADEAWENLVARQTKRIVDKFCDNQVMKNDDVEHCLTSIGAASYGGGSGSRAHNMV